MIGSDWIPSVILRSFCYYNNAQATTTVSHLTCNTEKIITKGCYGVWAMHVNRNLGPSWFWQNVWTNSHYMYVSNIHVTVRIGDHAALKFDTKPVQYVTRYFWDWRGTALLRHRNCTENVIILVCEQKPYQALKDVTEFEQCTSTAILGHHDFDKMFEQILTTCMWVTYMSQSE